MSKSWLLVVEDPTTVPTAQAMAAGIHLQDKLQLTKEYFIRYPQLILIITGEFSFGAGNIATLENMVLSFMTMVANGAEPKVVCLELCHKWGLTEDRYERALFATLGGAHGFQEKDWEGLLPQ